MDMDRRTFVKSIGGLAVVAAFSAAGGAALVGCSAASNLLFTTPDVIVTGLEKGPVMRGGIQMVRGKTLVEGQREGTVLFTVDDLGAELIRLADGMQSIDDITLETAQAMGISLNPADVAQFYVALGQSGYLANRVEVNLFSTTA